MQKISPLWCHKRLSFFSTLGVGSAPQRPTSSCFPLLMCGIIFKLQSWKHRANRYLRQLIVWQYVSFVVEFCVCVCVCAPLKKFKLQNKLCLLQFGCLPFFSRGLPKCLRILLHKQKYGLFCRTDRNIQIQFHFVILTLFFCPLHHWRCNFNS